MNLREQYKKETKKDAMDWIEKPNYSIHYFTTEYAEWLEKKAIPIEPPVMQKIYGVVEWINEHPILDGMQAFKDKESCYKYCKSRLSGQVDKNIFVKHTIIEINFSA